eukprot:TRINITY_DN59806_c0_g1_i1.p1 TRINITY_DN59806_c0_g1~~TRINITY_DN59806_c0_g1_i1.p1  ORF type:complete len:624 (+),score=93.15 TRINITY_DN59806_c0_g1_i1:73-1872(+)
MSVAVAVAAAHRKGSERNAEQTVASFDSVHGRAASRLTRRQSQDQVNYASNVQRFVHQLIQKPCYELGLVTLVLFNVILMVIDLDNNLSCSTAKNCTPQWPEVVDSILLGIYTLDFVLGLFAERWMFFKDNMHWLDMGIVLLGYVELLVALVLQGEAAMLNLIRIFRLCRLLRLAKLLRPIPELYNLLVGFVFTVRAIFWGFVMILLLCLFWAIVILQSISLMETDTLFDDDRFGAYWCKDATGSTWAMMLLLWQTMITGDSWGACTLPVILREPSMYFVFAAAFVCVNIGFTNLILAVIVEHANEKSEEDRLIAKLEEQTALAAEIAKYQEVFCSIDADASGALSVDELLAGYDCNEDLQNSLLMKFGIDRSDLSELLSGFDQNRVGEVPYDELIRVMFRSQRQEAGSQLMMIHSAVSKLMAMVQGVETMQKELKQSISRVSEELEFMAHHKVTSLHASNRDREESGCVLNSKTDIVRDTCEANVRQLEIESFESQLQIISRALQHHSLALVEETRALTATLTQLTDQQQSCRPIETLGSSPAKLLPTALHSSNCSQSESGNSHTTKQGRQFQRPSSADTEAACTDEFEQRCDERVLV